MEPSSLFGTKQLENQFTFTASLNSQCSPPPAPRPALAMLPSSESEADLSTGPLTSMNNLLSSLSQNQNPESASATTNGPHDDASDCSNDHSSLESTVPSSSSGNALPSSSPPNSSPPDIFSSSPQETSPFCEATVTDTKELPPASLHRTTSLRRQKSTAYHTGLHAVFARYSMDQCNHF
ncbi:hypothetical protein BT96DRAFT_709500 [Gymnopus androsaceus JB14]|uniref:Uncharacterized protein n=1 Tax=Gymnopus androsaceus JB14 TaxID=1447944 RepID=A0A6A4HMP4_9AGAR|nr:hypothetical protein BT96DRAFT_709500 [Gymnopus androsaceus JB14]